MIFFYLLIIFFASLLSLACYLYCWQDIQRGYPHIISLRQITGIMDRERLTRLFGTPQGNYRYRLKPEMRRAVRLARTEFFYQECAADIICMVSAWRYIIGGASEASVGWFILLAGLCQGVNLLWSGWMVRKWGHQIREEMEKE